MTELEVVHVGPTNTGPIDERFKGYWSTPVEPAHPPLKEGEAFTLRMADAGFIIDDRGSAKGP